MDKVKGKQKPRTDDYDITVLNPFQTAAYGLAAGICLAAITGLFYKSFIVSLLVIPAGFLFVKPIKKILARSRKKKFTLQFKDLLYSISTSLSAGASVETAFHNAVKDLEIKYEPDTDIMTETQRLNTRIALNTPVEEALTDLANRTHVEDVQNFADVFSTCNRTSGNISEVIRISTEMIAEKIETKQDIDTMLYGKRLEARLVVVLPVIVLAVLNIMAADYIEPLYTTLIGRLVMTGALGLLAVSFVLGSKIIKVEV